MTTPNPSIVIPARNEAAGIGQTLAQLATLRSRGCEVIVADGGSHDDTARLAEPLADTVLDAPAGRARQMNAGAAVARGDALLFLHADTRPPDDADALVHAALADHVWGRFDVRLSGRRRIFRVIEAMMNRRSRLTGIATGDQALFMRREVFERIGGFADQPLMEDIDISRRLKAEGRPACLAARVRTSSRRWQEHGVRRMIVTMWALRLAYFLGVGPKQLARFYPSSRHDPS